ncbi:hypothetical protein BpHYR1_008336 [Brachionus plicatilis]|uniref:Transmembrane protein n=1 Tax=Brachionus plicatilis TaxID=10195 RepID=A0A3M7SD99_BRAPC|nr:hypothetical protein BpHYR1_008336 [Brachionus plicatilis]
MNFYGSNCQFKNLTQKFFPIQDQPNPSPCPDRKCQNTKNIFKYELLTTKRNEKKDEGLNIIGIVIPIVIIFFIFCIPFTCRMCIYAYGKQSKPIGPSSQIIQTNDETYQIGTVSSLSGSLVSVPSQYMYANDFIETNSSPYRSRQSSRTFPENDQMETSSISSKSLPPAYDKIELDKSHDLPSYDQIV